MGLASSQARMLLLTARKSDLEYRAQAISQRKINIAMQTEQLATQYSRATSNRVMNFVYYTDGNTQDVMTEKLSYQGLMAENGKAIGDFLVRTINGKYVYTGSQKPGANGEPSEADQFKYSIAMKLANQDNNINNKAFYDEIEDDAGNVTLQLNEKRLAEYYEKRGMLQYVADAANPDFFQSALRNGSLYLYQGERQEYTDDAGNKREIVDYSSVAWSSLSCIQDSYNTEDDAAAQAEYEAKTLILSNQDKMLDLELNQIETQHKAIETEYDSVKKVIEKNIDTSYKIFA